MKLSTILIVILVMDVFCFYGIETHDAIMSYPSYDPTLEVDTMQQIGERPMGVFMEFNSTTGEMGGELNETAVASFTTWAGDVGIAVLSALGQYNIARDILSAISLLFRVLTSPFVIGSVIGSSNIWFVGTFISLIYTILIALAGLAAIRGGET